MNPITGRLLIFHGTMLSSTDVGQLVRDTVALAVRQAATLNGSLRPASGKVSTRGGHRQRAVPSDSFPGGATLAASAVVAIALTEGKFLFRSAVVRFGGVLVATVIVVQRGWRRTTRSQTASTIPLRSTRHPLLHIVGPHRRQLYLASLLSILAQLLEMALQVFVGWILLVLTTGTSAALVTLGLASAASQLWFLTGMIGLVCVGVAALSFFAGRLWRGLGQSVQHEWRTKMYAHVQRVELRYLEGERTTRITRVLTDDIDQLGRFFDTSASNLVQLATSFFLLIPIFLFFAPNIAWIAFLPVPVIAWMSFFYQERVAPDYAAISENGSLLNSRLTNNLEASATVKSFGAEAYEIDRIHDLSEQCRLANHRIDTRTTAYAQAVRVCAMAAFPGILLLGGLEVLNGTLRFEVFNALLGLPPQVLWKLPTLGPAVDQYHRAVEALRRVLDLRSLPVESGETGRALDVAKVNGELVFDGVTFSYPGRSPVLDNLSLRFAARRTTGIVGVTGAGKTTIAKLLLRFQDVASGRVLLDGVDVREVRLHDLRSAIGFVAQDTFLFDGTVGDNIRYGSFDAAPEQVVDAALLAEADSFVQALPSRYDTMVGERGASLSGGQKQRVSLARAILKSAPIVILDEATSAVDNETEAAIQHAIRDFARDRTLVIIAHRLSTIRHADWIYVLGEGGVVVEEGTHQELLDLEGVYASLWRPQIGEATA
ncbi:MAG: ABC transporter ATP-binding protein [Pseudonocardiales bacterium]